MKKLKIYFTSDLHGYVYPTNYINNDIKNIGLLNIINNFDKDENTLIIDGGDTIQGSPFTNYIRNNTLDINPIATIFNDGGYDYVTVGNHDLNYGLDYLKKYINNLDAKCLCCNIDDSTNDISLLPYDIKTMGNNLRVGIIGFTTDFINTWERPENIENLTISDTFSSVQACVDKIKNDCDILIGVYHGGFEYDLDNDIKLSSTSENIAYKICRELNFDLLLTGHQHLEISGQYVHNTFVVQTPPNGKKFIDLELSISEENKVKVNHSILIEPGLVSTKEMYEKFLPLQSEVNNWLDTPLGHLDIDLSPTDHLDMALNGSYLANFINEIQLKESNADISCTSFSNVIKGFEKNVTVKDIISTYMFPNTLIVLEVNRKYLKMALEKCASYFEINNEEIVISDLFLKPKVAHYNYDYFSGIDYTFDITKEIGNRVTSIKHNGYEISDSDSLTLVMNNYRATGAGGYEFYKDLKVNKEVLVEMPEAIINYFRVNKNVVVDKNKYINVAY